jgi:hypothetical protein
MNAYELADELDRVLQAVGCDNRVPRMLRQQADKIAELEEVVDLLSANLVAAVGKNLMKDLTDEEIKGVMALDECWIGEDCSMPNMIAFAKAILRKAQEK